MNTFPLHGFGFPRRLGRLLWLLPLALPIAASAQYIGFVYPAGGQHGETFRVEVGGQRIDGIESAWISGPGVTAKLIEYNKQMNPQEVQVLREQLQELRRPPNGGKPDPAHRDLMNRINALVKDYVNRPACASIADRAIFEITIAPDAEPGEREIRILTNHGLSNPMVFFVGEWPEATLAALPTGPLPILGKEAESLRPPPEEPKMDMSGGGAMMMSEAGTNDTMSEVMTSVLMESARPPSARDRPVQRVATPCTLNGQIAPGTVNRYLFPARKGQKLVVETRARDLVPYIADAVPGWFQPVIKIEDALGREVAYNDDYRFSPDPVLLFEPPADGDYLLSIHDSIFRGREDFVYRVSISEAPFITGLFPMGGPVGANTEIQLDGWNLPKTRMPVPLPQDAEAGVHPVTIRDANGHISNPMPFDLDTLPEVLEHGRNDSPRYAQPVKTPVIINGRIEKPGERDVYRFEARAGDEIVVEVRARRLGSPLDSSLEILDSQGVAVAFNDDTEYPEYGLLTHPADSYVRRVLPSGGVFYACVSDTQHQGGPDYAYRLRISAPRPDFALRVEPAEISWKGKSDRGVNVHIFRKDGFSGPIQLQLTNAPTGIELAYPKGAIPATQAVVRVGFRSTLERMDGPVALSLWGVCTNLPPGIVRHPALPAEDRMQAFLWRHLVPAQEFTGIVQP